MLTRNIKGQSKKIEKYLLMTLAGLGLFLVFGLVMRVMGYEWPIGSFLFNPVDRFMDFFNVNHFVKSQDPYMGGGSSYPPFALFIATVFSIFTKKVGPVSSMAVRETRRGLLSLAGFYFICIFLIALCVYFYIRRKTNYSKPKALIFSLLFLVNAPMIYLLDRGNYLLLTLLLCFLFFLFRDKNPLFSAVCLGLVTAMKIYPGIFFLLLLKDKKIKEIMVAGFTGGILTVVLMFMFRGGWWENTLSFMNNVFTFASGYADEYPNIYYMTGLTGLLRMPFLDSTGIHLPQGYPSTLLYGALAGLFFGLGILGLFMPLSKAKKGLLITAVMIFIMPMSYMYNLVYLMPCILLFLTDKSHKGDAFYGIVLALAMVPKNYYYVYMANPAENASYNVSIQSWIDPLLMLVLIVALTLNGLILWKKQRHYKNTSMRKQPSGL